MKKYGTAAVEDACAVALDIGVAEYRFVRRYLERKRPVGAMSTNVLGYAAWTGQRTVTTTFVVAFAP